MCHTRQPLPSPDKQAHTGDVTPAHNLFFSISASQLSLAEVKTSAGGQGTCRREKGRLYSRCQHQQPACRQRCCLSFNSLSVCVLHHRNRTGLELAEERQAGWCPLPTLALTSSKFLWESISVKERVPGVIACLGRFLWRKNFSFISIRDRLV